MVADIAAAPHDFARFLDEQPDLGTKWRPTFVRITAAMPTTATRKISTPVLRQASWQVSDPVFLLVDGHCYAPLDASRTRELNATYARHSRPIADH